MAANWWLSSQRKHFVKAPGELRAALGRAHGDLEPRELFDRKLSYTECEQSGVPPPPPPSRAPPRPASRSAPPCPIRSPWKGRS